jgi:protein associated with RNAse G/E
MASTREITVHVLKHDGAEYRRWRAKLARHEDDLIVLDAEFDIDVSHELLGEIKRGTKTVEYYWLDRWYNVFQFLKDDGSTRLWYCNINTPPKSTGDELTYVDLDIDILVQPDFSFQILDADEFETNAKLYGYSEEEHLNAQSAVKEIIAMIDQRQFPFALESSSVSSIVSVPGAVPTGSRDSGLSADPVAAATGTDTPSTGVNS